MKRISLSVTMVLFLFLFSFVNINFAYGEVSLSITSKTANPVSTVSVPIILSNNDSIVSLQFDVVFNNLDLEVSNSSKPAELGNALKGTNFSISSKLVEPGRIRVIITPPLQSPLPLIPDGTIVIISMKVKQNTSGSKETINFDKVSTSDANGDSEPLTINKGTITIQASTTSQKSNFSDISPTDWYYTFVEDIAKAGITTGYPDGTYRPDTLVTRAQMAAFLARALKLNIPNGCNNSPFYDVDTNIWFCPYVEAIKNAGVTTGYPDGSYGPDDYVTRAQMVAFLVKALHLNTQPCTSQPFSDVPTDTWYCPYVQALKNADMISGYPDGTYRPDEYVTRAIMAAFIDKAFLKNNDNSNSENIGNSNNNEEGTNFSSTILSDNFSKGLFNWTQFGSPLPQVVNSFEGHSDVFDNNGDGWCDSGIFSNKSFNLQPGMEIDADIYLEVDNYDGCWNTINIALTKGVPLTSGNCAGDGYYAYTIFKFDMSGQACWADSPDLHNHSYVRLPPDFKRILADKYVNGWHHLKIVINSDYTETVYIDNTKIGTSSSPIPEDYRKNVKLMLAGRSSGYGGKSYIDNVKVIQ